MNLEKINWFGFDMEMLGDGLPFQRQFYSYIKLYTCVPCIHRCIYLYTFVYNIYIYMYHCINICIHIYIIYICVPLLLETYFPHN